MLSAEQIADRVGKGGFIGASEIAAALGVSWWSAPIDVWLDKTGRAEPEEENPRAHIGHRAEPVILDWYCEDVGLKASELKRNQKSVRHREFPHAGCTPDAFVFAPNGDVERIVQVKCVGARMAQLWPDEEVPSDVECQCQFEMEIVGATRCDVPAWLGGTDFRIVQLERDEEFGKMLLDGARQFWRYIERDVPPPIDGSESWRRYLIAKYPAPEDGAELLPATTDVSLWAHRSLECRESIKEQSSIQDESDNHLIELIGDGVGFFGEDFRVTWKADKNGRRTLRLKRRSTSQ